LILAHHWGPCHTIEKLPLKADYDMYQDDHGFPVTTIRPRPIVAFAIAVHTASRGAPFGSVTWLFSA
jgi:hypothetical protein